MSASDVRRSFAIVTDATALGDDGVAISMLLASPNIDIKLIVCTSGNVWAETVLPNINGLLARFGRADIPVVIGLPGRAHAQLIEKFDRSRRTVILYAGALSTPIPSAISRDDGYHQLAAAIRGASKLNLLIIGPASPVAAIIREEPELVENIGQVFMMGGALRLPGNATRQAEFNFWFDPEAADLIFKAAVDTTLVPMDATAHLVYSDAAIQALSSHSVGIRFLKEYLVARRRRSSKPFYIWDEALSAIILDPGLIEDCSIVRVRVGTGRWDYGKLLVTYDGDRRPVKLVTRVNPATLSNLILRTLSQ
jgi:purine nucleosidase